MSALALQWPASLYSAALAGMHRPERAAFSLAIVVSIRAIGSIVVLATIGTFESFFWVQIVASLVLSTVLRSEIWRVIRAGKNIKYRIRLNHIGELAGFSASMGGVSLVAVVLPQVDKLVLSGILEPEAFGYYAVASTLASGISFFTVPIFNLIYPKFSALAFSGKITRLVSEYFKILKFSVILLFPVLAIFVYFGSQAIFVFSGLRTPSSDLELALVLLSFGHAILGVMHVPYAAKIAFGRARGILAINVFGLVVLILSALWLGKWLGALGGALAWLSYALIFAVGMLGISIAELRTPKAYFEVLRDICPTLVLVLLCGGVLRLASFDDLSRILTLIWMAFSCFALYAVVWGLEKPLWAELRQTFNRESE